MARNLIIMSIVCILLLAVSCSRGAEKDSVQPALFAGQFYPENQSQLSALVGFYLNSSPEILLERSEAVIVPHAGYVYSGQVAAMSFRQIDRNVRRVFILAANHNGNINYKGLSLPNYTHYTTPLGTVKVSDISDELRKNPLFVSVPEAHTSQVIEVELPFLQTVLNDFEIIPLIAGQLGSEELREAAEVLERYMDNETLFVFSMDFSHYHPYEEAVQLDSYCIYSIMSLDPEMIGKCTTDANNILMLITELANKRNWQIQFLDYRNSGDVTGTKDSVVGYVSLAFYQKSEFGRGEEKALMDIARNTMELYVRNGTVYEPPVEIIEKYPRLMYTKAAFVSLDKNGSLRGSIGHLVPLMPLYRSVRDNAINAATRDSRFSPVQPEELDDIRITVSVLDLPHLIETDSPENYAKMIRPFTDGVTISYKGRHSTYLPQVWDILPEPNLFLSQLCLKQGSPQNCWLEKDARLYTYTAQVIYEGKFRE